MRDTPPCSPPVRRADVLRSSVVEGPRTSINVRLTVAVQIARGCSCVITLIEL